MVISVVTYGAASGWAINAGYATMTTTATACVPALSVAGGVIAGAAAGFAAGVSMAAFSGASLGDALQAGFSGAFAGAITGGIAGYFWDSWNMTRVTANSIGGGLASKINGGKFEEGAKLALATSLLRVGWEYTKNITNTYKYTACAMNKSSCQYNKWGDLLTDGVRGAEYMDGYSEVDNNWFTRAGMAKEGFNTHGYSSNSRLGWFVNKVSKPHDWLNSNASRAFGFHGYSYTSGLSIAASETYNTLYQLYSFSGMLPAGIFTAGAMLAPVPVHSFYALWNED